MGRLHALSPACSICTGTSLVWTGLNFIFWETHVFQWANETKIWNKLSSFILFPVPEDSSATKYADMGFVGNCVCLFVCHLSVRSDTRFRGDATLGDRGTGVEQTTRGRETGTACASSDRESPKAHGRRSECALFDFQRNRGQHGGTELEREHWFNASHLNGTDLSDGQSD